jgi:hypothetical protein
MSDLSELLSTNVASIKEPPQFPAGTYRLIITGYDWGSYAKSGARGFAYRVKPTACLDLEPPTPPEVSERTRALLAEFGDWTNREFTFVYKDKETGAARLLFSPLTFTMFNPEPDNSLHSASFRFYLNKDGVESGFAHDILGLAYGKKGAQLGKVLEDSLNKELVGNFEYEDNPDSTKPYLVLKLVSSI